MYCKYCGHEIADDSIFCAKCGQKVQQDMSISHEDGFTDNRPIPIQITGPTRVQIVENKKSDLRDATNMQWKKPIVARVLQSVLAVVGLFFLVYGIVWISIVKNHFSGYGISDGYWLIAEDSFGIVSVGGACSYKYSPLDSLLAICERQDALHHSYKSYSPYLKEVTYNEEEYKEVKQTIVSKFRLKVLLVFILPALTIIALASLWAKKITPKTENKSILPRDLANKVEDYTWNGFTFHKYLRFIKNDNYGILDAVSHTIVIPALFELIEWREKNKSYDGVLDGERSTYLLKHDSNKQ
jgi:hypothetical protein